MSGQQKGVQFSEAVGVGNAPPTTEYNRSRGAAARVRQGSPNFQGYFRPPGTQRGNSNVALLTGQMGALSLGQGQGQGRRKSRKGKKSRKSKKGSRKN
jgi:hypothetical protein